jgi:hypothetical protein
VDENCSSRELVLRVLRETCSTPPRYPTIRNRTCKIKLFEHFIRYRMTQPLRIKQQGLVIIIYYISALWSSLLLCNAAFITKISWKLNFHL